MRFFIDAMWPPSVSQYLNQNGHDAVSPDSLGIPRMEDRDIVLLATDQQRVIVTENAKDFYFVASCPVLIVLKSWWPRQVASSRLGMLLDRWAAANPEPGPWTQWLPAEFR